MKLGAQCNMSFALLAFEIVFVPVEVYEKWAAHPKRKLY